MIRLILLLLLAGCASTNPALELAEEPGEYLSPIKKDEWAFSAYGFYISRSTDFGEKITYDVLYDNRKNKKGLMAIYEATDNFKRYYPAFVRHKGKTDCGGNMATIQQLDDTFNVIKSEVVNTITEVSTALCSVKNLAGK